MPDETPDAVPDDMPHHGRWLTVRTPHGPKRIRCRLGRDELETMAQAYHDTGSCQQAGDAAGRGRRSAHYYLDKLGVLQRENDRLGERITYECELTGESLRTRYPWGTVHRAVELYAYEDLGTRDVGEHLGVPAYTVWNWMDQLGLARTAAEQNKINTAKNLGFPSRAAMRGEMERMRSRHDCTIEEIAQAIGCTRHLVQSSLNGNYKRDPQKQRARTRHRRKMEGKDRYAYPPGSGGSEQARRERRQEAARMRAEGKRPLDIAAALDVSVATVYNDLNKMEVAA